MPVLRFVCRATLCALFTFASVAWADSERLRLEGSTTLLPALRQLAEGFRHDNSSSVTDIHGGGSAGGIASLIAGDTEIASSSRFLTDAEWRQAAAAGVYPVPFRVAHDAVIPIVHKKNRLRSLTMDQLGQIFSGRINNWQQVGGPDRGITLVVRDTDSGTHLVWSQFVAPPPEGAENVIAAISGSEVVRTVADHRGAIGYIGLGNLSANVRPLGVNGIMGSIRNVRSGIYPLARSLFLFTDGWPGGATLEFIDYVLDPDRGQRIIDRAGLVPLFEHPPH